MGASGRVHYPATVWHDALYDSESGDEGSLSE